MMLPLLVVFWCADCSGNVGDVKVVVAKLEARRGQQHQHRHDYAVLVTTS